MHYGITNLKYPLIRFKRSNGYKILSFQTYKAVCLIPQVYRVSQKATESAIFYCTRLHIFAGST